MKFEVGDKVKIRRNLKDGEKYNEIPFVEKMKKYEGETAEITRRISAGYELDIDDGKYCWSDDMLEMEWKFSKEDLRDGDIITLRSDVELIKIGETIQNEYVAISLEDFTENLEDPMKPGNNRGIIKVERPVKYKTVFERVEDEKKEILDGTEKEYLKAVIKPFKKRFKGISKIESPIFPAEKEFLQIQLNNDEIILPYFEKGTMYKGMKTNVSYTLKELELDDED